MATHIQSTDATSAKEPSRRISFPMVQNFYLVWLDESMDKVNDNDCHNSIIKLRQVVNAVNTFTDIDECIDFITDINEKVFVVISGKSSQTTISIVQDIPDVSSIYIFSKDTVLNEQLTKEWSKVCGVYADISSICEALKQVIQDDDQNSVSISFIKKNDDVGNQSLDTLDASFMYTQILKDILLTIDFEHVHFDEFITYCRERFVNNPTELKNVDKIEKEYLLHPPIWWYTYQCFLYSMVNRALRAMDFEVILKTSFFIRDLHNHLVSLHNLEYNGCRQSEPLTVYRGQGLSLTDFEQMKKTQGGLLAFNNFLSTSRTRNVSLGFARRNINTPDLVGILFIMKIDPSASPTPFVNIRNIAHYQREEEILFSMHSIFRIGPMERIENNDRLWQVDLTLTSDHDPQLQALTKTILNETDGETGWLRLGKLMIKVAQFDKAQKAFQIMLDRTTEKREKGKIYHHLGLIKSDQGEYTEALSYYEKALEIKEKTLPANHPDLAISYNNIGSVYNSMGEYSKALPYYEKALEIDEKTLPADHPSLATSYNNIGLLYKTRGEYSKALSYYEKALEIFEKTLPANHPSLATSYNNIGLLYNKRGEYSKALSYYEKALEIDEKTLPANHPDLATSYNNIGLLYYMRGEYSKALSYSEKAIELCEKTLPANHPELATFYNNIAGVYSERGEYSKALPYYENALEIDEKTLPADHPSLATSYNNIGLLYNERGEYSKALSYYEKALEIFEKTLPANHPDLATSCNNIGLLYNTRGEYSKALPYYEKALEIRQKTLPANHPYLATSYNNIGGTYNERGEYSKALSYHEKALEINEKTLPANHPSLAISYNNIGSVYNSMGEYSKALPYYEKALEIRQKTLPANHPDLATSYNNIGATYNERGEYSKALSHYEKALEIFEKTLPANHPSLATSYNNIGGVYNTRGEYSKALSYAGRALDIWKYSLPPNHPHLITARKNIEIIKKTTCRYFLYETIFSNYKE